MSVKRRSKKTQAYYNTVPPSGYRRKTITRWLIGYIGKYGSHTVFVFGLLIFISGIIGEWLDLPGYQVSPGRLSDPSRLDPVYHKPKLVPYWMNCILGGCLMTGYIRDMLRRK